MSVHYSRREEEKAFRILFLWDRQKDETLLWNPGFNLKNDKTMSINYYCTPAATIKKDCDPVCSRRDRCLLGMPVKTVHSFSLTNSKMNDLASKDKFQTNRQLHSSLATLP